MRPALLNQDVAAGLMFIAFGAAALWFGRDLAIGSASFMEAGYLPRVMGILMVALGVVVAAQGILHGAPPIQPLALRPFLVLIAAVALFALMLGRAGLVLTTIAVAGLASFAGAPLGWRSRLALLAVLAGLVVGIFHYGLRLTIPLWPA